MALTSTGPRIPVWPAIIFLVWNCLGLAAFTMQSTADLSELAKTDPYQAKIWSDMPGWAWGAYSVAVGAGLAGALALIFRMRFAVWLSALCVIAVIIQFGWTFLGTDLLAVKGWSTALFPLFILVMAVAQTLYARSLQARGALR
jgi:hypothetical protein